LTLWAGGALANGWEHNAIPLPALLDALQGGDAELRARAAFSLAVRREPTAVAPMLVLLARPEPEARVRSAVYEALGLIGDRAAVPALIDALRREAREELRATAAAALGAIGDPAALPALLEALRSDPILMVHARVLDALGGFAVPEAVAALAEEALTPDAMGLHLRAVAALGATRAPGALEPLLEALDQAATPDERLVAVDALGRLGNAGAADALAALLEATTDEIERAHVAAALGNLRDGSALPSLAGLLADASPAARLYAVRGLQELGDSAAAEPLHAAARAVVTDLAQRPAQRLLDEAPAALSDYAFAAAALQALIELDAEGAETVFLEAAGPRELPRDSAAGLQLAAAHYELRRVAIAGLGYSRGAAARDYLLSPSGPLAGPDPRLRAAAVRALAVSGADGAARRLLALTADANGDVRWAVAGALGRLGDPTAVPALIALLGDPHGGVRAEAALGLGYLGDTVALPALEAATQDSDPRVRAAASASLRLLQEKQ
jgi:HEAT repeat protein